MDKAAEIGKHINTPYVVGETVEVRGLGSRNPNFWGIGVIQENGLRPDGAYIDTKKEITPFEDIRKYTGNIGHNPFESNQISRDDKLTIMNLNLYSLVSMIKTTDQYTNQKGIIIPSVQFNPYVVFATGERLFYQRSLVWSLRQKQRLIESIYGQVNCGQIVLRHRSFEWNNQFENPNLAGFVDVVDGKQRISTLISFINNEFPDLNGYLYDDLSDQAKRKLMNMQPFAVSEFGESASDHAVLDLFTKINVGGVQADSADIDHIRRKIPFLSSYQDQKAVK